MERISPEIDLLFRNEDSFLLTGISPLPKPPDSICRNSHFNTLHSYLTEKQTEKKNKKKTCQSHLDSNNHNLLFGWNTPLIHGFGCENILALNAVFPRCFSDIRSLSCSSHDILTSNAVSANPGCIMIYQVGESNKQTWIRSRQAFWHWPSTSWYLSGSLSLCIFAVVPVWLPCMLSV